ncbi:hypothetical protein AAMO2058_000776000 [Amorphochlora amoebiformis]
MKGVARWSLGVVALLALLVTSILIYVNTAVHTAVHTASSAQHLPDTTQFKHENELESEVSEREDQETYKVFRMESSGPERTFDSAYTFHNVCMTFNTANDLEKVERGILWFNASERYPKRCVPCSNPLLSHEWEEPGYRDYFENLDPTWEKEGGLLGDHKTDCGMMWVHKIVVNSVTDYEDCSERHSLEIKHRGQTQSPRKVSRIVYTKGTTLSVAFYHKNIGHQIFDSLLSIVPLLSSQLGVTLTKPTDAIAQSPNSGTSSDKSGRKTSKTHWRGALPYQHVISHQLPRCNDSFYICNILRHLGAFRGVKLISDVDDDTLHCFEHLIVPIPGYYGRQEENIFPLAQAFRTALFNSYKLPIRTVPTLPMDKASRKPIAMFYRHAKTARRVWTGAESMFKAFRGVFEVVDVLDFGAYSFRKQAEYFHRADLLIMAHGAQFANAVFCSPGAVLYEVSCSGYSHVASAFPPKRYGVTHYPWKVPCKLPEDEDPLYANFSIPIQMLVNRLEEDRVLSPEGKQKILHAVI